MSNAIKSNNYQGLPNAEGFFGEYGGQFVPPQLAPALKEVAQAYEDAKNDPSFIKEYQRLLDRLCRPTVAVVFRQKFN